RGAIVVDLLLADLAVLVGVVTLHQLVSPKMHAGMHASHLHAGHAAHSPAEAMVPIPVGLGGARRAEPNQTSDSGCERQFSLVLHCILLTFVRCATDDQAGLFPSPVAWQNTAGANINCWK